MLGAGLILVVVTVLGILGGISILSVAIVWKMISSASRCAGILCLWVILVSTFSTVFAFVLNSLAVAQDENCKWYATWNGILGAVTAIFLFIFWPL